MASDPDPGHGTVDDPPLLVVMGVSASGKSTVGERLAERLDLAYLDADDLHTDRARARMSDGTALTDEDRWPWLDRVGAWLGDHDAAGGVVACSALRRAYRDRLRESAPRLALVYLDVPEEELLRRIRERTDHFMPASLLRSQLDTLEPPADDERVVDPERLTRA